MVVSLFDRSRSRTRGLRRKPASRRHRRSDDRLHLAIDQLESRVALSINQLTLGIPGVPNVTVGSFLDAPTGPGSVSDFVTVSIEGTKGQVIFNGGLGVADGTNIQTIEIVDASPDFQVTFNATVGTANAVPYGSDGVIQMGRITTANVIRGINTVRGPLTNTAPTTGVASPIGFTQTTAGSNTLFLEGNQTTAFPVNAYVCATPLLSNTTVGAPTFGTVTTSSFDVNTNITTIVFDNTTAAGTTAGALTLAERVQPSFELTTFTGVNFSNRDLKDGGGLFVDRVVGADTTVNGEAYVDLGILLTDGLLAYSSIGIRDELDAGMILGTTRNASTDGRVFIESATALGAQGGGYIIVGPRGVTAQNSKLQLLGGSGEFAADVVFTQNFNGIVNLGSAATGVFDILANVGPLAVLNADSWNEVYVAFNFAGTINSTSSDMWLSVAGNVTSTAKINAYSDVSLEVGGSVLKGATINAGSNVTLDIAGNLMGSVLSGGEEITGAVGRDVSGASLVSESDITLAVAGNVLNSTVTADNFLQLNVLKNVTGSQFQVSEDDGMSVSVRGNVTASRFNAASDDEDADDDSLSLAIGGNLASTTVQGEENLLVAVAGNVSGSQFISTTSSVSLSVGGNLTKSRIDAADDANLAVVRDALNATVLADGAAELTIGRNWSGTAQSGSSDVLLNVGGSVLKGSAFVAGDSARVNVVGNFDGSVTSGDLRYFVGGNVSQASRIVAQQVTDWQESGGPNFYIGGRLDGIVNVVTFDAAPENTTVAILGNGAGASARFYVDRFLTDTLVFNGNFRGNLRVLQDLTANLEFNGNVDRITIGGRVGSYVPGNTITTTPASIAVTGRLLYLNTNSYFQAITPGKSGVFWNDATSASPSLLTVTGSLVTGSYVTVVPTRQTVLPPVTPPAQQYSVPGTPTGYSAALTGDPTTAPFTPYGINVTFAAPTSSLSGPGDGNLPVLYYEYTTNANLGAGATWRRFSSPAQGPGSNIALPGPSTGGSFTQLSPATYFVSVRAVNALGAGNGTSATTINVPGTAP